jgi:hypothetical protein
MPSPVLDHGADALISKKPPRRITRRSRVLVVPSIGNKMTMLAGREEGGG